jgi:ParB-like chromosome segregation protein Spo0J
MQKTGRLKTLNINEIRPYWRNPRANDAAVKMVVESIRKFGYNQYICVDKNNIIIVGHARWRALKELGYERIDVIEADLDPKQAKQYRIIDNKTSEFAEWTDDLSLELREIDDLDFMQQFFKEKIDLSLPNVGAEIIKDADIKKVGAKLGSTFENLANKYDNRVQDIVCPKCGHEFKAVLNQRFGGEEI